MLTDLDKLKLQTMIAAKTGLKVDDLRFEAGHIRFTTHMGDKTTLNLCKHLLDEGLQSTPDDGEPEFFINGTEGANKCSVRWPFDPELPTWNA